MYEYIAFTVKDSKCDKNKIVEEEPSSLPIESSVALFSSA